MARHSLTVLVSLFSLVWAQTYTATYTPENAPDKSEQGQAGTNRCGTTSSQDSMCQNAYLNSLDDFCLWAPPQPGPGSDIGNTERIEVAWCMKSGYGTRLIPDGAIKGVHFVQTPDYVQITGIGDLTKLNIPVGDQGGELDPHGADGNGNPIGGLVFSNAFKGQVQQVHEWTNFMSASEFCFRACNPAGKNAPQMCQHIYDVMGCAWNMPARYDAGVFESCKGDSGEPMGVYGKSTFHQGDPQTPGPHPAPSSSLCTSVSTLSSGQQATQPSAPNPSSVQAVNSSSANGSPKPPVSGSGPAATGSGAVNGPSATGSPGTSSAPAVTGPSHSLPTRSNAPSGTGTNLPQPSNNGANKIRLIDTAMTIIASFMITSALFST